MRSLLIAFLLLLIACTVWLYVSVSKTCEGFASTNEQAQCFACAAYFVDALKESDIVGYVQKRADFLDMVMTELTEYLGAEHAKCLKEKKDNSITAHTMCFSEKVRKIEKRCTGGAVECQIVTRVGDDLLRRLMVAPLLPEEFVQRMNALIAATTDDIRRCRVAFQNELDPCVKQYKAVAEAQKTAPVDPIDKKIGDVTSLMMSMQY
jgi:hypothetical protein